MLDDVMGVLGIGLVGLSITGASLALSSESLELGHLTALAQTRYEEAFSTSPWSYAPLATGGAFGVALALSLAERALLRRPVVKPKGTKPLVQTRRVDAVAEVRSRLEKYLGDSPDAVSAWDELLRGAAHLGASDVHVSPGPERVQITYRIQGDLHEVGSASTASLAPLVARIKVLSHMDTTQRSSPQDGRLVTPIDGGAIEARVSTLPTESGERVVLRFLRGGLTVPEVAALGFTTDAEQGLMRLLSRAQGLIFVTGPVGNGKTTTLYAALQHLAQARAKTASLVTLEDPIELELPFATQTQINPKAGMTFASTLRSVLRQDPNVLMVGEIRDQETAEIAMQAGLTGHMILTTVHGQSATGVFARLIEMGVEPFLLASATLGCLSQRLVRQLCRSCRKPAVPDAVTKTRFAAAGVVLSEETVYYEPVGCERCEDGFAGRIPICELLELTERLKGAIQARRPTGELAKIAEAEGMKTLWMDGMTRAARGETTLLEILRVAG